ncbi:MAG: ABC transporter ATP-binding protein [Promethearchaeota archaeon]
MHITKYLKPYTPMIIFVIGLLYIQANANLALPDYFSDIVNIGIQQGGVENSVPEAIRQTQLENVFLFMDEENKTRILSDYNLITNSSIEYNSYLEKYPALQNQNIYVINNDLGKDEIDNLNKIFAPPLITVYILQEIMENPELAQQMGDEFPIDFSNLPPGIDIFQYLKTQSYENLTLIKEAITSQFSALGENMMTQAGAKAVLAEYESLGVDLGKLQTSYILRVGGVMLLITMLYIICAISVGYLTSKIATGFARDLRHEVFQKVENFSNAEFDKFSTASLITRTTNDITQIQFMVIMILRLVIFAPIMGIGGIIRALDKALNMWWILALAVIILLCLIFSIFSIAVPKFKLIQKLIDRLNLVAREQLSGMLVIRAFNKQKYEEERFNEANKDVTKISLFVNRLMVIMMPAMMFLMNILTISIIWIGSHEVANANIQIGDMMAFMQYAIQIVMAFLMMSIMFVILPRALVSSNRIAEILATDNTITDPPNPKKLPEPFKGILEFNHVNFRYPNAEADVLHDITFKAEPGTITGIIGPTGCGKTTILNLIIRLYDVTKGSIKLDGVDIRKISQRDLRDKIGYVPQKSVLFSGTILSNMLFANENATKDQIQTALSIAQIKEFIDKSANGLNIPIAQGGMNVSGGQKQRLSIARALLKNAPIYLFDDSFSSLDFKTESALRRALRDWSKNSTILIVTQRIAPIMDADQIIVLDEGKIVGIGTHDYLIQNNQIYREIAITQLNLEGLNSE